MGITHKDDVESPIMPINPFLIANLFFFGFTLWLGTYLLARSPQKMTVRLTGFGLFFFALALASEIIWGQQSNGFLLLPALCWIGAVLHLIPEEKVWRSVVIRIWGLSLLPVFILTILNSWFSLVAILALLLCVVLIAFLAPSSHFRNTYVVLTVIGLFFSLSTGLLILPLNWFPHNWMMTALGLDLFLLGVAITVWDAFDEGESVRAHLTRSFVSSLYYAGTLTVLILLATEIDGKMSLGKLIALIAVIAFGIITQTFSNPIQRILDRLTSPHQSTLNDQREALRETADELPRLSALDLTSMDEIEFTRLTRRAISHLGDLPKLSASPLTNLPCIILQTAANPLDRAHMLKSLLIESIQRLKPQNTLDFGTTDEWRYYNALYYPYVLGLKPYSRSTDTRSLDETSRKAIVWFQESVPERTLHNWQSSATKLIADDLRNKI